MLPLPYWASMDKSAIWNVLKWVLAALAAGFIGQFGRVLAMRIIERRRAQERSPHKDVLLPHGLNLEKKQLKDEAKIEKKRAAQEVKREKKSQG